jgi:MtN3 and saliva related transmembrane protein
MIQAVGFGAAGLTSLAFAPQVLKTWRTRAAGDLSTTTLLAQTAGVGLWIVYGVAVDSLPVIASNTVTLVLMMALVAFKWKFRAASVDSERKTSASLASHNGITRGAV